MCNLNFDITGQGDIAKDIGEITALLQEYSDAQFFNQLDHINQKANAKIAEIRCKDDNVFVSVLPSPPNSTPLSTQAQAQNLYNILNTIKAYLETKLIAKQRGDSHE